MLKRWSWSLCLCILASCNGEDPDVQRGDSFRGDAAGDPSGDAAGDPSGDAAGDPSGDAGAGDSGGDSATAPVVVATQPLPDATGVPVDAVVSLTFDQAMQATSITPTTIALTDFDGSDATRQLSYDDVTFTVASSPLTDETLVPLSPYRLMASASVRAANGLALGTTFELPFVTATFADLDAYRDLAEAYAPVIYAEVRESTAPGDMTHRIDQFTSLDFDGDWNASNNPTHALEAARQIPAHVYFNVLETESHFFVQYILYYPLGVDDRDDLAGAAVPHDFAHSVVVVQKLDSDPLGRFVMAEGLGEAQVWALLLTSYPDTGCGEVGEPPCGGVTPAMTDVTVRFDESALEPDGGGTARRYPMYVVAAGHPSCLQPAYDPEGVRVVNRCVHDLSAFTDDYSRVLRLGNGDAWTGGSGTARDLTYTLSPFLDAFWARRGDETVFADTRQYAPPPGGAGASVRVPATLAAPSAPTAVRAPPFVAEADAGRGCGGCSRVGVWFVDPIWEIAGHVDFAAGHPVSTTYCFNPFLGIDVRGEAGCE